eukprot:CAMPEP_0116894552 /NCGR_PEP_ID=MMETSP0467-20121206/4303_1 /TAXON_ID=283647 /ORGANISM="Mesodinium pulex, Strain SPMC105" /LENGTH=67 /DNA_ID=CAMNT_0004564851 /DNA_START=211 /DNA_END=414 /DNA_ORIENTATION=-
MWTNRDRDADADKVKSQHKDKDRKGTVDARIKQSNMSPERKVNNQLLQVFKAYSNNQKVAKRSKYDQ